MSVNEPDVDGDGSFLQVGVAVENRSGFAFCDRCANSSLCVKRWNPGITF